MADYANQQEHIFYKSESKAECHSEMRKLFFDVD
jgi:hypothetical protein